MSRMCMVVIDDDYYMTPMDETSTSIVNFFFKP